eukprot:g2712.t1
MSREDASRFQADTPVASSPGGGMGVVLPPGVLNGVVVASSIVDLQVTRAPDAFSRTQQVAKAEARRLRRLSLRRRGLLQADVAGANANAAGGLPAPTAVLVVSLVDPNGTALEVRGVGTIPGSNNSSVTYRGNATSAATSRGNATSDSGGPVLSDQVEVPEGAIELVMPHDALNIAAERKCQFWTRNQTFSTDGCAFVQCKSNRTVTICACQHLTAFNVNFEEFLPKVNTISADDILALKWSNIQRHPIGLQGIAVVYGCSLILIALAWYGDQREKDQTRRRNWVRNLIKRIEAPVKPSQLAKDVGRDKHLWLAIFIRPLGDNFTSVQRVCVLTTELFVMLCVSAVFFA